MIFAILFIMAFLIGLITYLLSNKWLVAVLLSMALFVVTTLADTEAQESWSFTLIFGLPIVFVASLLGAYVVELRRGESVEAEIGALDLDQPNSDEPNSDEPNSDEPESR
ncbi:MAG: hypothetical protein JKX81_08295 [Arenicella sp.]|nr:hypothetical protein [Arenicella sp.]